MIKRRLWEYIISLAIIITVTQSAFGEVPAYLKFGILSEEEATVDVALKKGYQGEIDADIVIPSTVNIDGKEYSVTTVRENGFNGVSLNLPIRSITLPPTLKYLSRGAFYYCPMSEVIIEADRLEETGAELFKKCKNLKSFDLSKLPRDISKIGESLFLGAGIEEIVWPDDLPVMPKEIFMGCPIRSIILPPTLERICESALAFTKPDTLNIPDNVTIERSGIGQLFELKEINFGEGCTLESGAFYEAFYLEKLYLPLGTIVKSSNFTNFLSLKVFEIADDVQFIASPYLFWTESYDNYYGFDYPDWYDYFYSPPIFNKMEKVIYHTSNPQEITSKVFIRGDIYTQATLYVDREGMTKVHETAPWNRFKTINPIPRQEPVPEYLEFGVLSEEEATVEVAFKSEYSGNVDDSILLPSTVTISGKEYTVTAVKDGGFSGSRLNRDIQTITLGTDIKRIGESAFSGSSIKYLVVTADRLDEIGNNAFRNCVNLKKFTLAKLPTDITKIGTAVFYNTGLEELEWPEDVTTIPEDFFRYSKPKDITLPDNVIVKSHALSDLYNLKALKLGKECVIEDGAFGNLFRMQNLTLSKGTKIYGTNFSNSLNLQTVRINGDIEFLEEPRLYMNVPLEAVEEGISLPEGFQVGEVPPGQWDLWRIIYRCTTIPSIALPSLFRDDIYDITELYLPASCIEPAAATFPWNQFGKVKLLNWLDELPDYLKFEHYGEYELQCIISMKYPISEDPDIIIPRYVKYNGFKWEISGGDRSRVAGIGKGGFRGADGVMGLKTILVPETVEFIEKEAFSGSSVEEILFEDRLYDIGHRAFEKCKKLRTIDLEKFPSNPTSWGRKLFYKSAIKDVTWPKDKPVVPEEVFFGCEINKISFPETLRSIEKSAFQYAKIDSLAIPESVEIQGLAFSDIFNLKDLKLGTGCTIDASAFNNAFSVTKLTLPSGTKLVGEKGFNNWLSIKELEIAEDVQFDIHQKLFSNVVLTCDDNEWNDYPAGYRSGDIPKQINVPEKVIYHTSSPQYIRTKKFLPQAFYDNAILYVNADGVEKAKKTLPWSQFKTILPISPSSIDSVKEEKSNIDECPGEIYTINGIYAGTTTESLSPGIYILRQGSRTKKIVIE